MCGICGIAYSHSERPANREILYQMTDIMIHRGPDSRGFHFSPGIGLGIRRLSIIDIENGDQPISNEDKTIHVVCNGEIYNFKELREQLIRSGHTFRTRSDTEVIVHLYEDYGTECVNHLRGMFAFAIWDSGRHKLMLARDRLGIKPLFYSRKCDCLLFGSEMKSILTSEEIDRSVDVGSLKNIFEIGFVISPKTFFRRIRRLLPGHYLIYQKGEMFINRYWDLKFPTSREETPKLKEEQWSEALKDKLEESVRIHLRSDVALGSWLSAGIDSSVVTALASRMTGGQLKTFSIAFKDQKFDELRQQNILSDSPEYNISNRRVICKEQDLNLLSKVAWHFEDPIVATIGVPRTMLSRLSSQEVKVVLTGEGSDEIFGGYPWFGTTKLLQPFMKFPHVFRRIISELPFVRNRWTRGSRILGSGAEMDMARYKRTIDSLNSEYDERIFSDQIRRKLPYVSNPEDEISIPDEFTFWHPFCQLQYLEIKTRLTDFITRELDASSMTYSLEARVPFLDHELVEFCALIPPELKMRRLQEKYILRQAVKDLLPPEIHSRKKRGLAAPLTKWLQPIPDFAKELISEQNLLKSGYFNPEYVACMVNDRNNVDPDHARNLMGVLRVQLCDELFVKGCKPGKFT